MTVGAFTTYDLSVGIKLDIEDVIWLVSPFDVPLLGTQGSDGRTTLSSDTCFEKKIEWLDEELLTPRSSCGVAVLVGDLTITLAAGDGIKFQAGDLIKIDEEDIYISSIASDVLTVTRQYGGTTAAAHVIDSIVIGIGSVQAEGSDAPQARAQDRVDRLNYTQIFGPVSVQVSGSENAVQKYGLVGTEFDHQVANRAKEQNIALEQTLIYGNAYEDAGNQRRSMGGIRSFITTNVDSGGGALTEARILAALQDCYDNGGSPDRILVPSEQTKVISAINEGQIRYPQQGNTRGQAVDYYDSPFGRQEVVLDRWLRSSDVLLFARDQATVMTLRPLTFEMLAKTGDSTKGQVVGEKSLRFRRQSWSAQFQGLS